MKTGSVIASLIAGVLIYGLAMGTTYPLLGILLSDQVADSWNGISAAATGLGLLAGVAVVPVATRRLGAGRTALAGVVLMAAALVALAATRAFWPLFAARLLLGCGANMLFVVADSALNLFAAPSQRGRLMGWYTAAVAFGFVVGPAVVALFPERPTALLLACALVTACALLPLGAARAAIDSAVAPAPAVGILSAVAAFPSAFAFLLVASAVDAVVISLLPVIARGQGYSMATGAAFVGVFHVGLLVGQPIVGSALDRLGRRRTVIVCCTAALASTLVLTVAPRLEIWTVGLLLFVWGGANYGLYTAGLALIGDRFSGAALSAATAAFAAVYAAASVASPVLAGAVVEGIGAAGFYLATMSAYLVAVLSGAAFFHPAEPTLAVRRRNP